MSDYSLRDQLIDSGVIRPAGDPTRTLMPARLPAGAPILRLDETGRAAAKVHMREGRFGAVEVRLDRDRRAERRPWVTR